MTPDKIRSIPIPFVDYGCADKGLSSTEPARLAIETTKTGLLREIAAQIAELNEKIETYLVVKGFRR